MDPRSLSSWITDWHKFEKKWGLTLVDVDVLLAFPPSVGFFEKRKVTEIQKTNTLLWTSSLSFLCTLFHFRNFILEF